MSSPSRTRGKVIDAALWTLSALLLGTLTTLSLVPSPPVGGPRPVDLILHVAAYAPTTLVLLLAAVWRPGRGPGRFPGMAGWIVAGLVLLGAGIEVVQGLGLTGPRQGEPIDALANALGVAAGFGMWSVLETRV
ncbi:MAG: VanZ family protein [Actinomycetota bacterium]